MKCTKSVLVSGVVARLVQLDGEVSQLLGMGGVVADHVLHQRHQLLHGRMLAGAGAGRTVLAASVGVGMLRAVGVEVGLIVRVLVVVGVRMGMLMGVGNAVMGMLVGMGVRMVMAAGHVFGIDMHRIASFIFLRNL